MEFLKNHYEKVALGIVLLVLALVAAWLPMQIQAERADLEVKSTVNLRDPAPLEPSDTTLIEQVQKDMENPPEADFSKNHNTFNSVVWIKQPDGNLIKQARPEDFGVYKLQVDAINPLNFTIDYDKPTGGGYYFNVVREDAANSRDRRRRSFYVSKTSGRNEVFSLVEVRGPEEDPLALVLSLNDTGEQVVVSKSKSYHATNGWSADLSYPLEKQTWKDARVKQPLLFAGDTNIIVDINPAEVILRAVSNEKTTTIPFKSVP